MKKKKLNKAQRQAGHRLCNNIKNSRNHNRSNVGFEKTESVVFGNITQEYITHATGEYSMDQHVDISKLVELRKKLTMASTTDEPQVVARPQENSGRGRGISEAFSRLVKILRKKSA